MVGPGDREHRFAGCAAQRLGVDVHVRERVEGDVGEQPLAIPRAGLESVDRALRANELRGLEREDAGIGADVDHGHSGTDEL